MLDRIQGLKVRDVECDELWSYVGMKARTKDKKNIDDPTLGDAWTFTAIERHSKLIIAWHLGHRTMRDTLAFAEKIARATEGSFQISTDGFKAYQDAVVYSLGAQHVDFAQIVKIYRSNPTEPETRYSPAQCIGCKKEAVFGSPDMDAVGTSRIERHNLSVRMETRRFTRLTNGFSKKWEKHHAALALYFAYYNFCRSHKTLGGVTPAMASGIVKHFWTIKDLLQEAQAF